MTIDEFGRTIKTKYPQYNDLSDADLGQKMLAKYPQYSDMIDTPVEQKKPSTLGSVWNTAKNISTKIQDTQKNLAIGAGKGVVSTLKGIATLGEKGIKAVLPQKAEEVLFPSSVYGGKTVAETQIPENVTKPSNVAQAIGKGVEQIGEFLIPVGGEVRALNALKSLIPKAGKALQLGAKAIGSGLEFAGKTAAQTGGDKLQTGVSSGIGLVSPVLGKAVGSLKKGATEVLPERLNSIIFKTAEDDLRAAYKTIANGEELNPTLAKEALERGIKGNSENMAVYSFKKLEELENKVQESVKGIIGNVKQVINLDNKSGYQNVLQTIKDTFNKTFNTERAKSAQALLTELKSIKGNTVSTDLGLRLRRFIDDMRNTKSFTSNPNLSAIQEGFKESTNQLRKKLADAGLEDLMNEERVFIRALDDIVEDAVKRKNKNVLGLFDLLAGGGGMASGGPLGGVSAALAVRGFQQPFTITNLAQALYKMRNIPSLQGLFKTIPPAINQISQ